jgi:ribosomal 50S subunit-recycling heat shock protein
MAKEKRIVATGHAIVSQGIGAPSRTLAPGDHIVIEEDNDTHKSIIQEIESGRETNLEVQEVDVSDENNTAAAPDPIDTDDVLQAPARALEQEVREAPFQNLKDAGQPKEAKEGAKEIQESVEAEQDRQVDEGEPGATEGSSSKRGSRKGS